LLIPPVDDEEAGKKIEESLDSWLTYLKRKDIVIWGGKEKEMDEFLEKYPRLKESFDYLVSIE